MPTDQLPKLQRWVPVGTRYSNSEVYDEATSEVVHGYQVYVQKRADGTSTGRRSFVNDKGVLCGIEMAERERQQAIQDAAPLLLSVATQLLRGYGVRFEDAAVRGLLRDAVASASGVRL